MSVVSNAILLEPSDTLSFLLSSISNDNTQSTLRIISNESTAPMLFKVKTTRPLRYLVRPNQGIIQPGETALVIVVLQKKDCYELLSMNENERSLANDKFLVQSASVTASVASEMAAYDAKQQAVAITEAWNNMPKEKIASKKLRCAFTVEEVVVATEPQNATELSNSLLRTNLALSPSPSPKKQSQKQETSAEVASLRKKYDELVAFTVQLTAQRDNLVNELDDKKFQLKKVQDSVASDAAGLRQRKVPVVPSPHGSTEEHALSSAKVQPNFPLSYLAIVAIVAFILGQLYR